MNDPKLSTNTYQPDFEQYCFNCRRWRPARMDRRCSGCGTEDLILTRRLDYDGAFPAGARVRAIEPPEDRWHDQLRGLTDGGTEVAGIPVIEGVTGLVPAYNGKVCYLRCHDFYLWQFNWLERL